MRHIALICAGALVAPLDSAVNIAFPAITDAFAIVPRDIQWVVLAFVVSQSLASLVCGRLGDLHGHRVIFAAGMASCVVAHWAVAQAQDFATLVALRVVQGIAVGMAVACAPALIAQSTAPGERPRMLALYAAAVSAGVIIGPLAGGLLVEFFGWQGVFQFRMLLSLGVVVFIPFWLSPFGGRSARRTGLVMKPSIAWQVLRSRSFTALQIAAIAIYLATFSILLWVPFLLAQWSTLSIAASGLVLTAFPMGSFAASLLAARGPWPPGTEYSTPLVRTGLACAACGLAGAAVCATGASAIALAATLFFCGVGLGCFQAGYMEQTMRWLPADNGGIAGSLVTATRLLGLVAGAPILSALGTFSGIASALGASSALLAVSAIVYRPTVR